MIVTNPVDNDNNLLKLYGLEIIKKLKYKGDYKNVKVEDQISNLTKNKSFTNSDFLTF